MWACCWAEQRELPTQCARGGSWLRRTVPLGHPNRVLLSPSSQPEAIIISAKESLRVCECVAREQAHRDTTQLTLRERTLAISNAEVAKESLLPLNFRAPPPINKGTGKSEQICSRRWWDSYSFLSPCFPPIAHRVASPANRGPPHGAPHWGRCQILRTLTSPPCFLHILFLL